MGCLVSRLDFVSCTGAKVGSRSTRCEEQSSALRQETSFPSESTLADMSHHFILVKKLGKKRESEREGKEGNSFTERLIKTGTSSGILEPRDSDKERGEKMKSVGICGCRKSKSEQFIRGIRLLWHSSTELESFISSLLGPASCTSVTLPLGI